MRLARVLSEAEAKRVQSLILLGGVFTTLAIWTNLEDPINLPKMFVLVIFAAIVLGLISQNIFQTFASDLKNHKITLAIIGLFGLGLAVATVATDVHFTAFFGEFHRSNGFLSYFAMIILMTAAAITFGPQYIVKYFKYLSATGLAIAIYGFLQNQGQDPIDWVIQYNPVITTLGNPNFTSGFLGLSGISTFYLFLESKKLLGKVSYGLVFIVSIFTLIKSGSIQGFFSLSIGVLVILVVKAWLHNRKFGQISLILVALLGTPFVLAVVNVGPLAKKLYQDTLRNRLDYWNAAIGMFKDHPIFGVGIDRFGEYYRQYAVQNQVVQGQITDNAHSIYLQLLATGGLIVFIPYLILISFITYRGFRLLISSKESAKLQVSAIFGIWLGSIVLNLVTVDNLGVGIWFWITGGVLLSVTLIQDNSLNQSGSNSKRSNDGQRSKVSKNDDFPFSLIFSATFTLIGLLVLVPMTSNSSNLKIIKQTKPDSSAVSNYRSRINQLTESSWNDPQNLLQLSSLAYKNSDIATGDKILNRVFEIDDRSYYAHYFKAFTLEAIGKRSDAIQYRERLMILDPWNNESLIELIRDYLAAGNKQSAASIGTLIKRNYPGSQADIDASALLVG